MTISFAMFDDLRPINVIHKKINKSVEEIIRFIKNIRDSYVKEEYDPTCFLWNHFDENMMSMGTIAEIANDLLKNEYYVLNRMAKYYVVAFALNFTRFEIYSIDCDKEIISWPTYVDNEMTDSIAGEGPIKGIIDDPDYNVNSVIKMMAKLNI